MKLSKLQENFHKQAQQHLQPTTSVTSLEPLLASVVDIGSTLPPSKDEAPYRGQHKKLHNPQKLKNVVHRDKSQPRPRSILKFDVHYEQIGNLKTSLEQLKKQQKQKLLFNGPLIEQQRFGSFKSANLSFACSPVSGDDKSALPQAIRKDGSQAVFIGLNVSEVMQDERLP